MRAVGHAPGCLALSHTGSTVRMALRTGQRARVTGWRSSRLELVPGGCRSRFILRRALSEVQVPAAGDVRRRGDPVLQISAGRTVKRPSRISSAVCRLVPAPVAQAVEAVWAAGGHVYGGTVGQRLSQREINKLTFPL